MTLNTNKLDGDPTKEKTAGLILLFMSFIMFFITGLRLKKYCDRLKPKKKYEYQEDEVEIDEIDEPYDHVVAIKKEKKKIKV